MSYKTDVSKLICTFNTGSYHEDILIQMDENAAEDKTLEPVKDGIVPKSRIDEYGLLEQHYYLDEYDYLRERIGERILTLKGKVKVIGSNLDWRGSSGVAEFTAKGTEPQDVGREFLQQFCACYNDYNVRMYYVGNRDTGKSFDLIVGHHDATSLMYVRPINSR